MLRRLLLVLVPLLAVLGTALGVPLAAAVAQRETQATYLDRLADVSRFASLAETALASDRTQALQDELSRYDQLYGIPVAVVAPEGAVLMASRAHPDLTGPAVRAGLLAAFSGYRPETPQAVLPWQDSPLVLVEPVGRDSEVVAAVVAVSATDRLRAEVLRQWGLLALAGVLPLLAVIGAAWPLSRWVLRPIRRLDEASAEVAGGRTDFRAADVSGPPELRRLTSSFNTMVEVVDGALRRQRDFVADASHQLRNPLASLRLAVDNLAPHLPDEDAREAQRVAVEEAEEMARVLDALLAATRVDAGRDAEPVEVAELVAARLPGWQGLGLPIEVDIPAGQRVLAQPGALGTVLDELVGNAARLSGASRVLLAWRDGELHVTDDGVGLDEAERAAALGRFWRAPRHQNVPGTGLGLAICADLIGASGGQLRLEQARPRGLDVVLRLPLDRGEPGGGPGV
ncbi:HAMP domain-containing sensor histidine kinase [Kutzneria viridogrisea]|uniref:histidine kinase n=2 Tax=Kutzneria TaxID=43356 RepID=W5WQD9_9PSEU|nr:HAMP domain-containing sensor histidine kinase [Kutzneria albida]AHI00395.1 hypothetical protein KALB_7037 [Kutzneria albida DSM 43870]MBA8925572.1 signal transduction histidine kinase [Kutzneria viridogrisea]